MICSGLNDTLDTPGGPGWGVSIPDTLTAWGTNTGGGTGGGGGGGKGGNDVGESIHSSERKIIEISSP